MTAKRKSGERKRRPSVTALARRLARLRATVGDLEERVEEIEDLEDRIEQIESDLSDRAVE
jgi:hypothetical protein